MVIHRLTEIFTRSEAENGNSEEVVKSPKSTKNRGEQCLSCRLIGGGGLMTFGFTILYYTRKNAKRSIVPPSKLQLFICNLGGVVVTSFGVIRLLDWRIPSIAASTVDKQSSQ